MSLPRGSRDTCTAAVRVAMARMFPAALDASINALRSACSAAREDWRDSISMRSFASLHYIQMKVPCHLVVTCEQYVLLMETYNYMCSSHHLSHVAVSSQVMCSCSLFM